MKAELKPEDFRLGNLITYEGEVFAIDEITKHLIRSGPLTINSIGLKAIDCGIELSEEWLKKAGFEDITEGTDLNTHYSIRANRFTIYFEIASGVPHCFLESVGINCYYVHSLQNLFYQLTGNELIFNHG